MSSNESSPPKLRVAVIGAGIGGLAAAAFLRKHPQYSVTLYERRGADFKESSAAFGMRVNGISIVKQLGITKEEIRTVVSAGYRTYNTQEELMSKVKLDEPGPDGEGALWLQFRQDVKNALLRRVVDEDGEGEPVKVFWGSHVTSVDPESGIVSFADGTTVEADLVIGADGIHSKTRAAVIPPSHPDPVPCGLSLFRLLIPMQEVEDAVGSDEWPPAMYNYDEGTFIAIIAAGDEGNRNVVMYPCRGHTLMNCAVAVPDVGLNRSVGLEYSWNAKGSREELLDQLQHFPPWLRRVFSRAPPKVELFQVRDQEPLPTYVKGRTVLIGDAAHPVVPYQGQGANQALEDVEGLNVLLGDVTDRDGIPAALRVWDQVRRPRASEIQKNSRISQAKISTREAAQAITAVKPFVSMREALTRLHAQAGLHVEASG